MFTHKLPAHQRTRGQAWRAASASAVAVLMAAVVVPMPAATVASPDCTLTIDDAIPIGPEQASVLVKFSSTVGDTLTVTFPEAANVVVISAKRGKDDGPRTATIVMTTLRATAGQWLATVRGEKGTCTGRVWIGNGKPKKKGA
jgi:polyisoprenoid-binding protein YceI